MNKRSWIYIVLSVLILSLIPVPSAQAVNTVTHKVVDCGRVGHGFGPDVRVCYRMVYRVHAGGVFDEGFSRPDRIRIRIKSISVFHGGGMPYHAEYFYMHVRIVDDETPPLKSDVTKRTFRMFPEYYANTWSMETKPRRLGLYPRVCMRVHVKILWDRDIHDSLKCKVMR